MAPHPRTFGSHTPLGHAVRVHWPAATWHIEVYNFRTELGIAVVEREPIRRYHPQINWAYNTGRLRIEIAESQLRGPRMGPACRLVIDTGWPSYHDVALESRGESRPAVMAGCSRRPCRGDQDRAFFEACFLDLVISLSQGRG
jgi:hypothetical protein